MPHEYYEPEFDVSLFLSPNTMGCNKEQTKEAKDTVNYFTGPFVSLCGYLTDCLGSLGYIGYIPTYVYDTLTSCLYPPTETQNQTVSLR